MNGSGMLNIWQSEFYLFWQQRQLGDVKVIIQHVELIEVLLLHSHSSSEQLGFNIYNYNACLLMVKLLV